VLAAQWGSRFREIKGYVVQDLDGRALGRVVGLMLNPEDGSVYLRVARSRRTRRPRLLPWEVLHIDDGARHVLVERDGACLDGAPPVADPTQLTVAEHADMRRHYGLVARRRRVPRPRLLAPVRALGRAAAAIWEIPAHAVWRVRGLEPAGRLRWRLARAGRRLDDARWTVWDTLRPRRSPRPRVPELPSWRPLDEPAERTEVDA
jgi:hypothetical protein